MHTILNALALVALSEMGDKTQLLALSLAARFKAPREIMAGILAATILNHALAATFGTWIASQIPARVMAAILAATFIAFGAWTLKPDTLDDEKQKGHGRGPFLTTFVLFFLAEMGDKTQLATVALAAKYQETILVTIGTTLGMLLSDGIAVFVGEKLTHRFSMQKLRWAAATLFFAFGILSLIQATSG